MSQINNPVLTAEVNVKSFGAVGNGVADDTAAIQAAVNSQTDGGIVRVPNGIYKITSKITMRKGTRLLGTSKSLARGGAVDICVIDAATITSGTSLEWAGNAVNHTIEDICLRGPAAAAVASSEVGGAVGIDTGYSGVNLLMRNVLVTGFTNAILFQLFSHATLINVTTQTQRTHGLCISDSQFIDLFDCVAQNAGAVSGANDASNVYIAHASGGDRPTNINLYNSVQDEASSSASSIYIKSGDDISINNATVYTTISGNGIRIGADANRVTVNNVRVKPFTAGTGGANTIRIDSGGAGHRLINVTTDAGTGGDILDSVSDTFYHNVNGKFDFGTLPSNYADDAAAAAGGVAVGGVYRNGSVLMVRAA